MHKKIFEIVSVIAAVALAYYAFTHNPQSAVAPGEAGAKINIAAVCAGALSYMTFPDAQAADAFIAECEAGKHPEVIERYVKSLDLGEGVEI